MFLADISIKRPVMMTMVISVFVVIGLFSLGRLGIDFMPDIDLPFVTIQTIYPGAGPEEIETLINKPIEEEVSSVNGVKNVTSMAMEGVSFVFIEFQLGEDVNFRAIDVQDKVDGIRMYLPDDIEEPVVQKFEFGSMPIIELSLMGPYPLSELYRYVDENLRDQFSRVSGVANVEVVGEQEREIEIALSISQLESYGISAMQVVGAFATDNLNLPAGRIERGRNEYTLRMNAEFASVDEIRATRIHTPSGIVRLDQIAQVTDGYEEQRDLARFNTNPSIGIGVVKQSDANTVQVAADVERLVEILRRELPSGMQLEIATNRSTFIRDSVQDVSGNLVLGIIFTAVVLFFFLHNWKGTLIAALSMPISIVSTFILLDFAGFTLNIMSLMGLAVSVGILVVNAVVVLENIDRYKSMGIDDATASSKGTSEIAIAVAAATLTNIVVFTPMAFMQGIIGPIFRQFGLTVAFSTIFSLLVSFTLTPMMSSRYIKPMVYPFAAIVIIWASWTFMGPVTAISVVTGIIILAALERFGLMKKFSVLWDKGFDNLRTDYTNGLRWALRHRFIVVAGVVILFIASLSLFQFVGSEFFPSTDERALIVSVEMPPGSRLEETNRVLNRIEEVVAQYPEIESMYTNLGKSGDQIAGATEGVHLGFVKANLYDLDEGDYRSTREVVNLIRPQLADIPAADIIVMESSQFGGGSSSDVQLELRGDDLDDLVEASELAIGYIESTGNALNVRSDWQTGKPEIVVRPDRMRLADRGGTVADVAMMLRTFYEGTIASNFREAGEEYDIRVRLLEEERNDMELVSNLMIPLPGGSVPLQEIADIEFGSGPSLINRKNKQRLIVVYADAASGTPGEFQAELETALGLEPIPGSQRMNDILSGTSSILPRRAANLPSSVTAYFGGDAEMMAETFMSMLQALVLAVILTYMLMAAIMESYRFPFIIMMTLPLALIGVVIALVITGKAISLISMMAIVMLVGIVVNNGILLIDYIQVLRKEGKGLEDAVLEACPIRLRPILMSTTATILGMLPLALGIGSGGEMRAPMAIVSIGGLIASTFLTLFIIPVSFMMMEARGEKKRIAELR